MKLAVVNVWWQYYVRENVTDLYENSHEYVCCDWTEGSLTELTQIVCYVDKLMCKVAQRATLLASFSLANYIVSLEASCCVALN